jgi:hypothetical protein
MAAAFDRSQTAPSLETDVRNLLGSLRSTHARERVVAHWPSFAAGDRYPQLTAKPLLRPDDGDFVTKSPLIHLELDETVENLQAVLRRGGARGPAGRTDRERDAEEDCAAAIHRVKWTRMGDDQAAVGAPAASRAG